MSLQPAQFSGETSGANARLADPAAMSQPELNAIASGDKVSGGRRRKSGRKSGRKVKKSQRKSRKSARKSARKSRSWFMM
jgi:hypothetical protein